jgi:hypothetical protein
MEQAQSVLKQTDAKHVQRKLKQKAQKQEAHPNSDMITGFKIGDYVLLSPVVDDGYMRPVIKTKLVLEGPLKIMGVHRDDYTVQDLINRKTRVVHLRRLRPFYYDPEFVDPEKVAMKEKGEFVVEKILEVRGDRKGKRKDLEFLVKWKGYNDPEDNTWEPWSTDLARNVKIIEFLRANKMAYLVPKNLEDDSIDQD